jgi:Rod binding domain-containing protein
MAAAAVQSLTSAHLKWVGPQEAWAAESKTASASDREVLRQHASRFVNVTFLSVLMRAMRKTVHRTGLLDGGRGEEIFRQQLDTVLIDRMSDRIATPLADAIVRQVGLDPRGDAKGSEGVETGKSQSAIRSGGT